MGKFAQNKNLEVTAVAQAVINKTASRYESLNIISETARTTLMISYRNMSGRDRKTAEAIGDHVLAWMQEREDTKDLRCDVEVHIQGHESISICYRTGIVDYGFFAQSDGNWSILRIKAA